MSEQQPAAGPNEDLAQPVQPKVAKDLEGNYVYYLPDKPVTEATKCADPSAMKTPVSDTSPLLSTTEQVITLSPAKAGISNIVTINSDSIIGRFDPETLNSINKLLEEVDADSELIVNTSKENPNTESGLTVQNSSYISDPVETPLSVPAGKQRNGQLSQVTAEIHSSSQLQPPPAGIQSSEQLNPAQTEIHSSSQLQPPPAGIQSSEQLNPVQTEIHSSGHLQPAARIPRSDHSNLVPTEIQSNGQLNPVPTGIQSDGQLQQTPAGIQSNGQLSQVTALIQTSGQLPPTGLQSSGQLIPVQTGIQKNALFGTEMQRNGQLSEVTAGIQSSSQLQPVPQGEQTTGQLPPASTLLSSFKPTTKNNSILNNSTIDSNVTVPISSCGLQTIPENIISGQSTSSVSFGNPVTIPMEHTIPVSQEFPILETAANNFSNQNNVGKELHLHTQTMNHNSVTPVANQNVSTQNQVSVSLQAENSMLSIPAGILSSTPMSQNMNQLMVSERRNQATEPSVSMFQNLTTDSQCFSQVNVQSTYQKNVNLQPVHQPVLQNTALPGFQSPQYNLALSTYQPVQVFSTPSSQYQQSRMSTPKYIPQLDANMTTSTSCPYNLSRLNFDLPPAASGSQMTVVQDGRSAPQQILTDLNMNTIQYQNSDISSMYSCIDQISAKNPLPTLLEQAKCMSPGVQNFSRNGYTHHLGLPVQSVSNQGSLYNLNTPHMQVSSVTQPQHYSTNLPQLHGSSVIPSLASSQVSNQMVNNFSIQCSKALSTGVTHLNSNYLSSATSNPGYQSPGLPKHSQQFYLPRPECSTPGYFSGNNGEYLQNVESQTTVQRSQPSRPNHSLKLMPKNQMLAVKKTISMYWPDFSNYPEVCTCDKFDMGTEIHVEQIWLHMNQMYYLPQIQILAIGSDEFVGIIRDEKTYVSVGEIMMRLLPKLQREVESFILQSKCEVDRMTLEELAYLKQRGCTEYDIHEMISLESLREMCRLLLNRSSKLDSETSKLTEAATGVYYRKVLEKHTRCSKCGGAIKCSDILDRYEAIDCPVSSKEQKLALTQKTYKDEKLAQLQKEVIENAFSKKKSSPQGNSKPLPKNVRIKIGRLLVGGTQFNTFKLNDKCYISLKELVAFKISTLQGLQGRLANLEYRPRPAPSFVDKYFIQNDIRVHNTLWIDTVVVRCMCCLGQQKVQMPLQKHFKCGDFEEVWEKELEGVDDCDINGTVFTLNPSTITISNKRFFQRKDNLSAVTVKKSPLKPMSSSCESAAKKPLTIQMRNLTSHLKTSSGTVAFTTRPAFRDYDGNYKRIYTRKVRNQSEERDRVLNSPVKTQEVSKDLDCSSFGKSLNNQTMGLNNLSTEMEHDAQPEMTEESILEIAAREAMLMPDDLNDDTDGMEYSTSVDSVIQAIGMGDGLPSEDYVMQEIEKGGLNLFDGVLGGTICSDSRSQFEDSDKLTVKTQQLQVSPRKSDSANQRTASKTTSTEMSVIPRRTESRKKRVPKRYEEYFVETDKKVLPTKKDSKKGEGLCTTIKHDDKGPKKKLKDVKKVQILHAPEFREKIKNGELDGKILQVIRHSELDGIMEMVPRNQEEAASVSPIADNEDNTCTDNGGTHINTNQAQTSGKPGECEESLNLGSSATSCDNTISGSGTSAGGSLSDSVSDPSDHSNSRGKSSEVINEDNIESLCSPIKNVDNRSCSVSPNTSSSSLSEELRTSRIKRVYDKVAALESSQDEYRILHMLATVAEVVTESGDEQTVSCDQQESSNVVSANSVENSAGSDVCINNVKNIDNFSDEVSTERLNLAIQSGALMIENALSNARKKSKTCDRDIQLDDRTKLTNREAVVNETELTNGKEVLELLEDDSVSKDSVPALYSPLLFDNDTLSDEDTTLTETRVNVSPKIDPDTEMSERLSKFFDAVNKFVDVMEFQREPGIATSRVRFLQGAEKAFPGLYGDNGPQRRKTFAVLLNRILYHQDELAKQGQGEYGESGSCKSLFSVSSTIESGKSGPGIKSASKNSSMDSGKFGQRKRVSSGGGTWEKTSSAKKRKLC